MGRNLWPPFAMSNLLARLVGEGSKSEVDGARMERRGNLGNDHGGTHRGGMGKALSPFAFMKDSERRNDVVPAPAT